MIVTYLYQHPGAALLIGFLFGAVDMFLMVIAHKRIARALERRREKLAKARQEAAALQAREEASIEVEEDQIICPDCWESRHPGQQWPFRWYVPCGEHLMECLSVEAEAPIQYRREEYASIRL
jgi:hypothetical protein